MDYVVTERNKPISIRPFLTSEGKLSWSVDKCHTVTEKGRYEGVVIASVTFLDVDYDFYVVVDTASWTSALKDKRKMTAVRNLANGVKSRAIDAGIKLHYLPEKYLARAFVQGLAK